MDFYHHITHTAIIVVFVVYTFTKINKTETFSSRWCTQYLPLIYFVHRPSIPSPNPNVYVFLFSSFICGCHLLYDAIYCISYSLLLLFIWCGGRNQNPPTGAYIENRIPRFLSLRLAEFILAALFVYTAYMWLPPANDWRGLLKI